jgi:hypothetical protein
VVAVLDPLAAGIEVVVVDPPAALGQRSPSSILPRLSNLELPADPPS